MTTTREILAWLKKTGSEKTRIEMTRYGIPNDNAFGVPMGRMQKYAKGLGKNHELALELWETGHYEARTVAVFLAEADRMKARDLDAWVRDFDSWAICDTACFHLFDRTPFAWGRVPKWAAAKKEFVRRAGYALIWSLSVHDKTAERLAKSSIKERAWIGSHALRELRGPKLQAIL